MSNAVPPPCSDQCCPRIRREVRVHCREFIRYNIPTATCDDWVERVGVACDNDPCGCRAMGKIIYVACTNFMKGKIETTLTFCTDVQTRFEETRCATSCGYNFDSCITVQGEACVEKCSNFQECDCTTDNGIHECTGTSALENDPFVGGYSQSCAVTPAECRWDNVANTCLRMRWCPINMCVLKNIVCTPDGATQQCIHYGACSPFDGACRWVKKEDGTLCDDGLDFTYDDVCTDGQCGGAKDLCVQLNVQCVSTNSCLVNPGVCDTQGGMCIYVKLPDGSVCDDFGQCRQGVCIMPKGESLCGSASSPVTCADNDMCHHPGVCDPATGVCVYEPVSDGQLCDDRNPDTIRDRCVEGLCLGDSFGEKPEFTQLHPPGLCGDDLGRVMKSYQKEDMSVEECKEQCIEDVTCKAIAHSLFAHSCQMYNHVRQEPISGWVTIGGSDDFAVFGRPTNVSHSVANTNGALQFSCYVKVGEGQGVVPEKPLNHELRVALVVMVPVVLWVLGWFLWRRRRRRKLKRMDTNESIAGEVSPPKAPVKQLQLPAPAPSPAPKQPAPPVEAPPILDEETRFMTEPPELW